MRDRHLYVVRAVGLALGLLLGHVGQARAADANSCGYVQGNGGWYRSSDRSGPYTVDGSCNAVLLTAPTAGLYGGSVEQDVSDTRTLNAASTSSQTTYTLNGQATFSFNFTGLTASGATVSFLQSNDWNGTTGTFTPVSEVNTGNGSASLTRSVDGQSAIGVEGGRALRVQVTTAGTGTVTLASNISVRSRYAAIRSPLPGVASTTVAIGPTSFVARGASSLLVKVGAANLYGYTVTQGATAGYFALLDATAVPAASAAITPVECVYVAANATFRTRQTMPDSYLTGLVLVSTSSCTTFTAVTPLVAQVVAR